MIPALRPKAGTSALGQKLFTVELATLLIELLLIWTQDLYDYRTYHMLRTLSETALERKYRPSMESKPPPLPSIELSVRATFNLDTGLA